MDIFAHGLWTNLAFYPKYKNSLKDRLWAVFFGIMPDLISFTPATIFAFLNFGSGQLNKLATSNQWAFVWARESYNYTHSLITFAIVFLIALAIRKGKIYWPLFGWVLHIFIDIFTHKDFYETPFLYPLSHYKFDHGYSWGHPIFMLINYSAILILYILIGMVWKKKEKI